MAFTKVVGAGIHTLSNIASHNINSSGIITATKFVGPMENGSGISTFYDLRVTNNLTVDGSTTTLDTDLIGVDRVEVGANSNTVVGVAITQSGTADLVRLFDGTSQVVTVDDVGQVGLGSVTPDYPLDVIGSIGFSNQTRGATGSASDPSYSFDGDSDTGMYRGNGVNILSFATAGGERLSINSSGELISTNGTLRRNASDSSFTVSGDTASNTGANINLYGASHGSLANVFRVRTGSTERLRIDSSGRVIITNDGVTNSTGTNTTYAHLTVRGNSTATSSRAAFINFARSEASANIAADEGIGEIWFGDQQAGEYGAIKCTADASAAVGDYPGRLTFHTTADGGTTMYERLRITSGGATQINGADDQDNLLVKGGNTHFAVHQDDTDGEVSLRAQDGSGSNNSKYMTFFTNPSGSAAAERLRISSGGETKFTVGTNKTVKFYAATHNDETNLGAGLGFSRASDGAEMLTGIFSHSNTGLGVAARDHITFLTGGTSNVSDTEEKLRIASTGDITFTGPDTSFATIMYTSNFCKLDLRGTGIANSYHYILSYGAGHANADDFHMVNKTTNGALAFRTGSSTDERLRIFSNGDISCGGATDNNIYDDSSGGGINFKNGGQLVIAKQAVSGADPLVWLNDTGQTTNKFLLFAQDGTEKASIGLAGNDLRFARDGYNETMRITDEGDVSIGGRDAALANYADGSTTPTQLAVVKDGGGAGSGYHEVAHFTGGTDSNDTGAIVRITQFNNDRGLYIKGGRGSGDQAKALIGLRDSGANDTNFITITQNTDQITAHRSVDILSGYNLSLGGVTGHAPLHVRSENTSYGKNAIFGASGWVNHASYHQSDANVTLLGRDLDGNDKGCGIEFIVRNTGNSNWNHGAITFGQDGFLRMFTGGAGTYVSTEKFTIDNQGNSKLGTTTPVAFTGGDPNHTQRFLGKKCMQGSVTFTANLAANGTGTFDLGKLWLTDDSSTEIFLQIMRNDSATYNTHYCKAFIQKVKGAGMSQGHIQYQNGAHAGFSVTGIQAGGYTAGGGSSHGTQITVSGGHGGVIYRMTCFYTTLSKNDMY